MGHLIDKLHSAVEWTLDGRKVDDLGSTIDVWSQFTSCHSVYALFNGVLVRTIKYQSPPASVVTSVAMNQCERSVVLFVLLVIMDFASFVSFGL